MTEQKEKVEHEWLKKFIIVGATVLLLEKLLPFPLDVAAIALVVMYRERIFGW